MVQSANTKFISKKTHRVLTYRANVRYRKNRCSYSSTNNSHWKQNKKILGTIWGRKLDSKFSKVLWCFYKLEIHKVSRFVKSHDWNLKFSSWLSQVSQIVLFKNEEKDWKERKKMKKWKRQSTSSLSLYVYGQKIILFENIVWKT